MPMHLLDRPGLADDALDPRRRGVSTMVSVTLHAAGALAVLSALRIASPDNLANPVVMPVPQHLVWMPAVDGGGGRSGGGDRSIAAPRRVREVGREMASTPAAAPSASIEAVIEPPEEISPMPVKPMADASSPVAGIIDGDAASKSAGPGATGAGAHPGTDRGLGDSQPGDGFGPGAVSRGPGVTDPTLIERVSPKYTADAMRMRIQGSVWIECVVLTDGSVGDARVMRSLDRRFGLDEEALKAAKRWRFRPGRLNGQPVPVIVSIELMFSVR